LVLIVDAPVFAKSGSVANRLRNHSHRVDSVIERPLSANPLHDRRWPIAGEAVRDCLRPILLKNSLAVATFGIVENVDPLERAQIDANRQGDGL